MLFLLLVCTITSFLVEGSLLFDIYQLQYNDFAINVYHELNKLNSGSFLVCPLSVNVILALVTSGANGETAKELSSALGISENSEQILEIFRKLTSKLQNFRELSSANKVYLQNFYLLNDDFKNMAVTAFNAEIESIDFSNAAEAAVKINTWVEDRTQKKIKNLLKADVIQPNTRSILVNTMYFQGTWTYEFSKIKKSGFFVKPGKIVEVDMMEERRSFNFNQNSELDCKFLELMYLGNEISMVVVLPNKLDGLPELENRLDYVLGYPSFESGRVIHVLLPKFKLETNIDFNNILKKLGIKLAFTEYANFSGIFSNEEKIAISKVQQKAYIEVDEKGTTAAASTAVEVDTRLPTHDVEFHADHPFLFYLHLKELRIKFFLGRYTGPV